MSRLADYLFVILLTLWVGGLWALGYISAPVLFNSLADRSLAGNIAGRQFEVIAWVGIVSAIYAMVFLFFRNGSTTFKQAAFWLLLVMLLLTLAGHFGIQPLMAKLRADMAREVMASVVRDRFLAWHGISSVLYLIQSVLGVALVTQVFKR